LYVLHDGDELIIYTEDRCAIIWKGIVHLEYEYLRTTYPANPECGQQIIFNRWVHGFQVGLQLDIWTQWFFSELPASLIRNNYHDRCDNLFALAN